MEVIRSYRIGTEKVRCVYGYSGGNNFYITEYRVFFWLLLIHFVDIDNHGNGIAITFS